MIYDSKDYTFYKHKSTAFNDTSGNFVMAKHNIDETWIPWLPNLGPIPYYATSIIKPALSTMFDEFVAKGKWVLAKIDEDGSIVDLNAESEKISEKINMLRKLNDGINFLNQLMEQSDMNVVTDFLTKNGETVIEDLQLAYKYFSK